MKCALKFAWFFGLLGMATVGQAAPQTAISMHGDIAHKVTSPFPYVNPNAPKGGDIHLGVVGTFDSLNPFMTKGTSPAGLSVHSETLVFERLMLRSSDEPFTLYANLAEKVEVAPDYSWVTFHMNPRAKWSDGKPVTAEDVMFSFDTLRDKGMPNMRLYYGRVEKATIKGNAITFVFKKDPEKGYEAEQPMLMALMSVLPKHYYEGKDFEKLGLLKPLGSGPYTVKSVEPGRRIVYERNPHFWGKDEPLNQGRFNFDQVIFDYYRDAKVAFEAFKAGAYDFYADADPIHWQNAYDFKAVKDGRVIRQLWHHKNPVGAKAFVFNTRKPLFRDPLVRRALIEAFDFETFNRTVMGGEFTRTKSFFPNTDLASQATPEGKERALLLSAGPLPKNLFEEPYPLPGTDGLGKDRTQLKKAAALLQQAGWRLQGGKLLNAKTKDPFVFELLLYSPEDQKLALHFAKSLKFLGIEMKVRVSDPTQYEARRLKFDYDMIINTWGHSLTPGNEQKHYWTTRAAKEEGSRNYPGIESPAVDALCDALCAAKTREDLVIAARALDRALLWTDSVIPLYYSAKTRLAYWDKFGYPKYNPRVGVSLTTWWRSQ
ncbi:MAG: ABC transporter substrate-binding protein [Candidatus Puniceispirillum sp.]|nr:ABC transporter substrate-binding protein [Candidatus Puniceispirillum sp.]